MDVSVTQVGAMQSVAPNRAAGFAFLLGPKPMPSIVCHEGLLEISGPKPGTTRVAMGASNVNWIAAVAAFEATVSCTDCVVA
jgi:hypothetical protein